MWAWLNPLNLIKLLSLVKTIFEMLKTAYLWVAVWLREREQKKQAAKIDEAVEQIKDANKIEDDEQRLKEKSNAACKLEQAFDPNLKCDD